MEIQSFILGMSTVLVIASVIVGVVAFFKVIKLKKNAEGDIEGIHQTIENILSEHENDKKEIYQSIDDTNKEIDSRCDKLQAKISKEIDLKNKNN